MVGNSARAAPSGAERAVPSRISPVGQLLLLAGAATGVFLAGGPQEGTVAAFLMFGGLALLLCPPQVRVPWKIWAAVAAIIVSASLAFLPHHWFGVPGWRQSLDAIGVPLPSTVSVTPRETAYWLAILLITAWTGLFALSHPVRSQTQLFIAATAVLTCGVYASLAIYARQSGWEYPYTSNPHEFGFFPNRNHTSTFLVTGCILALGILAVAFRNRHWFAATVAAISLTVCITALIFFTKSRGGIVSLAGASVLWVAGLGAVHRSKPLVVSFAAVFLGGILLLFASPGVVRDRLLNLSGSVKDRIVSTTETNSPHDVPLDGRILIFGDTLRMLRAQPVTGVGLGNFRHVFPMYRHQSLWEAPVLHPESDWLMFAAEAGLPAVVALLVVIGLLIRLIWPLRTHPYWPLRWAVLCGVFSAILHGIVDVPVHRIPLGFWILVLAGIGLQAIPREPARPSRVQHGIFIATGFAAMAFGIFLLRAQWFAGRASPPFAAFEAQMEIIGLRFDGKLPESIDAARRSLAKFPLADFLHFQLGLSLLRSGRHDEADKAFRAQRTINPIPTAIVINQGDAWIDTDPERTGNLWLEAIVRQMKIDAREAGTRNGSLSLYRDLLTRSASVPAIQTRLLGASSLSSEFTFMWLDQAAPALVAAEHPKLAKSAFVELLTQQDRHRFLQVWYRRGDREQLFAWLATQPDWRKTARPVLLRRLVDEGKFAEAVQAASQQFGFRLDIPEPGGGERDAPATAPETPADAFAHYWRIGNVVTAKRVLEDARAEASRIEPEVWRLSAAVSVRDGRWDSAWQHVERYLRATQPDSFP